METVSVAPGPFGFVKCAVGVVGQPVRIFAGLRKEGDADAARYLGDPGIKGERFAEVTNDALGDFFNFALALNARQNNGEFVTA